LLIQIPFEDNTGELPNWGFTQSLGLEFGSNYGASLLGGVTNNAGPEIDPKLFTFNGELKEQYTHGQSQPALKSNFEYFLIIIALRNCIHKISSYKNLYNKE